MVSLIIIGITALIAVLFLIIPEILSWALYGLFYGISNFFFTILDFFQALFRKLAGLDVYYIEGEGQTGDILISLFTSDAVKNALIALIVTAIVLVIVFTLIQFIRIEYTSEGSKNSKGPIIRSALKALMLFFVVPVVCIFGVYVGNTILYMIDQATMNGDYGNVSIAGQIFKVAVYDANPVRSGTVTYKPIDDTGTMLANGGYKAADVIRKSGGVITISPEISQMIYGSSTPPGNISGEELASAIDEIFATHHSEDSSIGRAKSSPGGLDESSQVYVKINEELSYTSFGSVKYFYNMQNINFPLIFIAAPIAITCLYNAATGMIMRLFSATILFIVSPPIIALIPIDTGKAYGSWKGSFIKQVISAYGTVVALNLFFQILEIILRIDLFASTGVLNGLYNRITHLFFILTGCLMLKKLPGQLSSIIGAGDAMSEGEGMNKEVAATAGKVASTVAAGAMLATGAGAGIAAKLGQAGSKFSKKSLDNNINKATDEAKEQATSDGLDWDKLNEEDKNARIETAGGEGLKKARKRFENKNNFAMGATATSLRASQFGVNTLKGKFANSAWGKAFNEATLNTSTLTGGKGVNQYDDAIKAGGDYQSEIMTAQAKKDSKFRDLKEKIRLDATAITTGGVDKHNQQQLIKSGGDEFTASVKKLAADADNVGKDLINSLSNFATRINAATTVGDKQKIREEASSYLTGIKDNYSNKEFDKLQTNILGGMDSHIGDAGKGVASKFKVDGSVAYETKAEVALKLIQDDMSKFNTASKNLNKNEMQTISNEIANKLRSAGFDIKDFNALMTELAKSAQDVKSSEKDLKKLLGILKSKS